MPEGEGHREIGELLDSLGNHAGWSRPLIRHFTLLLEWTRPQDWLPGKQPIVWLSVQETAARLRISTSQVRRNEARLHRIGALSWKDSPNHRRFGYRDVTGEIVEAWGVNLAPAAALLPRLRQLAEDVDVDRAHWRYLRHRIAAQRAAIDAAADTAANLGALTPEEARAWRRLSAEAAAGVRPGTSVPALERRLRELDHLDAALQADLARETGPFPADAETLAGASFEPQMRATEAEDACHGTHSRMPPLDYTTNLSRRSSTTVAEAAGRKGERVAAPPPDTPDLASAPAVHGVRVRDLLDILPSIVRLRLPYPEFGWPELIEATYGAAGELGVSDHAWGEACGELGRDGDRIASSRASHAWTRRSAASQLFSSSAAISRLSGSQAA